MDASCEDRSSLNVDQAPLPAWELTGWLQSMARVKIITAVLSKVPGSTMPHPSITTNIHCLMLPQVRAMAALDCKVMSQAEIWLAVVWSCCKCEPFHTQCCRMMVSFVLFYHFIPEALCGCGISWTWLVM